jgi:zinc protease
VELTRVVLPNGLTVLVKQDHSAPVVAVVTYVKAGYFDETDDQVGVAHVLEHMFFKGTPTRGVGAIAKATMSSGGYLNASTIYDHTSYYTVLPASRLADGLAIQADAYANSVIDPSELGKELEVIIQEVKRKLDTASAVATETLYAVMYDRHRIRRWRMGQPDALRTFNQALLMDFYRTYYRPENTILSVVGDIDPDGALRLIEAEYGGLSAGPVPRDRGPAEGGSAGLRYREWAGDIGQTQMVFGWRTPETMHPDTPALDVAATVLGSGRGSRLYRAVRDRQLASSISAYNYTPTDLGVFVIHADMPPDRTVDAARAVWAQVDDLRTRGARPAEVERAQRMFEAQWARRAESMESQANHLAEWEALGGWALGEQYLDRIRAISADEVTDVVRRHVDPGSTTTVIYRPNGAEAVATDGLGFVAKLNGRGSAPLAAVAGATGGDIRRGRPEFVREEAMVRVYRTARGVPILVRRKAGAQITHLGAYLLGGARDEPAEEAGLTLLMTRTAVKGTAHRTADEIAIDGEYLGGSVGSSVGAEQFGWGISVPTARASEAVALLADVVQWPTFPGAALETERTVALADVVALRDDMYRYPVRLATAAAFEGHPYGVGTLGTDATLRAITVDAARDWHARRVLGGSPVLAAVGDVDPDAMAEMMAGAFEALIAGAVVPAACPAWPAMGRDVVEQREKAQTALAMAFPGPARSDEARTAAQLIATMASGLGGRFFDELRDRRSLAYTVQAFASERALAGMFVGYIATSPAREVEARAGLLAEFERLRVEPVFEDELRRAQTYSIGAHAIRRQSGGAILGEMIDAWWFGRGLDEMDEYEARVLAVTPAVVQEVAQRYFDPARVIEGIVRGR